jgi:hypothetical protein
MWGYWCGCVGLLVWCVGLLVWVCGATGVVCRATGVDVEGYEGMVSQFGDVQMA